MKKGCCFSVKAVGLGCLLMFCVKISFAQLAVTPCPTWTPQQLVDQKLAGEGVIISNAKFNNSTGPISTNCIGTFTNNTAVFNYLPYPSGIIMTTGSVANATGTSYEIDANPSNVTTLYSGGTLPADPNLVAIMPVSPTTLTKLEFDFISFSSLFNFNYIFASTEYTSYTCSSYTDCFGFFVTGMNPITGGMSDVTWNIAIIPNSVSASFPNGVPVSINSLNGNPNGCPTYGYPTSYSQYFHANTSSANNIQYNGMTTDMIAKGVIMACNPYHMTLSIANASDKALGSAVFLKEGSFSSPKMQGDIVPTMSGMDTMFATCNSIRKNYHSDYPNFYPTNIIFDTTGLGGSAKWNSDYKVKRVFMDGTEAPMSLFNSNTLGGNDSLMTIVIYADETSTIQSNEVKEIVFGLRIDLCDNLTAPGTIYYDTVRLMMKGHVPLTLAFNIGDTLKTCEKYDGELTVFAEEGQIGSLRWEPTTGIANPTSPTNHVVINQNTTYRVYAVDNYGCWYDTADVRIELYEKPKAKYMVDDTEGCQPFLVNFTSISTPNSSDLLWTFGDGTSSTLRSVAHLYDAVGIYKVWLYATTAPECVDSISVTIDVKDKPHASFSFAPEEPQNGRPINFFDESVSNFPITNYKWTFGDPAGGTSSEHNPIYTYNVNNSDLFNVRLVVSNANGCEDDTIIRLPVEDRFVFYMPNSFTPNGDKINDVFAPTIEDVMDYTLSIYDRWGALLFFTHDTNDGWEGYDKTGKKCQQGNYVWVISFKRYANPKEVVTHNGIVLLIR